MRAPSAPPSPILARLVVPGVRRFADIDVAGSYSERCTCPRAEESLLDISLEEGMDRMDLDDLHHEACKRARSINPAIFDLRLAVDAAAEMQVSCDPAAHRLDS